MLTGVFIYVVITPNIPQINSNVESGLPVCVGSPVLL
jgi:hypothetical protein